MQGYSPIWSFKKLFGIISIHSLCHRNNQHTQLWVNNATARRRRRSTALPTLSSCQPPGRRRKNFIQRAELRQLHSVLLGRIRSSGDDEHRFGNLIQLSVSNEEELSALSRRSRSTALATFSAIGLQDEEEFQRFLEEEEAPLKSCSGNLYEDDFEDEEAPLCQPSALGWKSIYRVELRQGPKVATACFGKPCPSFLVNEQW